MGSQGPGLYLVGGFTSLTYSRFHLWNNRTRLEGSWESPFYCPPSRLPREDKRLFSCCCRVRVS